MSNNRNRLREDTPQKRRTTKSDEVRTVADIELGSILQNANAIINAAIGIVTKFNADKNNQFDFSRLPFNISDTKDFNNYCEFIELLEIVAEGTNQWLQDKNVDHADRRIKLNESKDLLEKFIKLYVIMCEAKKENIATSWEKALETVKKHIHAATNKPPAAQPSKIGQLQQEFAAQEFPSTKLASLLDKLSEQLNEIAQEPTNHRCSNAKKLLEKISQWQTVNNRAEHLQEIIYFNIKRQPEGQQKSISQILLDDMTAKLTADMTAALKASPSPSKPIRSGIPQQSSQANNILKEANSKHYKSVCDDAVAQIEKIASATLSVKSTNNAPTRKV